MKSPAAAVLLLLAVVAPAVSTPAPGGQQPQEKAPQFRVGIDLVSLDVEVLNQDGEPVSGLGRLDFSVRENDKPREISSFAWVTDEPVSLTVILDTSAVTTEKLSVAKAYATLLAHLLAREDEICVYSYDYRNASLEQNFTTDRLTLIDTLENIGVTSGKKRTFFKDRFGGGPRAGLAMDLALRNSSRGRNERKALLVVSDRNKGLGVGTREHVSEADCVVFFLNLSGAAPGLPELESDASDRGLLARESGGRQFQAEGQDMRCVCRSIAYALKNHYTMTYLTEAAAQSQRLLTVDVQVPGRNYIIHVRRSYTVDRSR